MTAAQQLRGTVLTFKGRDVVGVIAAFVKEYGITHVVIGRSQRPWYTRLLRASLLDRLLLSVPGVDALIVDTAPIAD